jgi:amidase
VTHQKRPEPGRAPDDPLNAFCRENHIALVGAPSGPLAGVTFAAKDVFDVAGSVTGAGQPDWLRTHEAADATAPVVQALLDAGARLVGKTQCDELVYSLNGENLHYGTPVNPRAPGRIPGGSSSGSASAVAGGLVDIALGTDCAGSVRLPAGYCGIFGFRPTYGRVPAERAVALAPSFDTVGWFTRDPGLLERVGRVLLPADGEPHRPRHVLLAADAFSLAGGDVVEALRKGVEAVAAMVGPSEEVRVYPPGIVELSDWFRVLQAREVWATHGEWITRVRPSFGPGIRERYAWAATVTAADVAEPARQRERFTARMDDLLQDNAILCLPTAPGIAPRLATPAAELEVFRARAISLLAIAGLAGLPQVSLPVGSVEECPVGLSLVAARDADLDLLAFVRSLPAHLFDAGR